MDMSGSISEGGMCPKGAHPLPKTKFSRIKKLNIKSNLHLDIVISPSNRFFFFYLPSPSYISGSTGEWK